MDTKVFMHIKVNINIDILKLFALSALFLLMTVLYCQDSYTLIKTFKELICMK